MARPLRIQYAGAFYHVMNRGNSRQDVFLTDSDRSSFLGGLADSCETFGVRLIVYVLMPNHFHLVVQTSQANLSEFMRHLLVTYTVRFNRKRNRTGHVFQGRYKSLIVEQDEYLLPLTRYIHLNPVRTDRFKAADRKIKAEYLNGYRWSSLPGYCYVRKREKSLDYGWLLDAYFGGDSHGGRRRCKEYVFQGLAAEIKNPFENVTHQSVLGTDDFVEWIKGHLPSGKEREIPSLRKLRRALPIEKIIQEIGKARGVEAKTLLGRNAKTKTLRQMAMELCYRFGRTTQNEIGQAFGVDYSTVSQNRKRLKQKLLSGKSLRKEFQEIERKIASLSK